jgi:3-hydroxyacyl-CoA dehydrogenase/enoyl-CoA hydratase/3-hydroxybutyryl-CoA epimerase
VGHLLGAARLGRKSGSGFYRYEQGHKKGPDPAVPQLLGVRELDSADPTMVERRLVYIMLNEAAMAWSDGVVRSSRDGDIGAVYGIGFPAFRGGPLRMIDDLGADRVVETLRRLEEQFGPRFTPAAALVDMAERGGRYYTG